MYILQHMYIHVVVKRDTLMVSMGTLLQEHSRSVVRQGRPKQHKRSLPVVYTRIKGRTESKLVIGKVKIAIASNRHCNTSAPVLVSIAQQKKDLLVSTQLILGSLTNSDMDAFAGL
jgi:hypothetical protein